MSSEGSAARPLRVAMFCSYSLSVPGGVQGQALGLARALRDAGHEAVVLAPCDGPPPEPGVVSLGPSTAVPANGSIAPVALGIGAQRRVAAALRDERFDVLHLHEPFAPGPNVTALLLHPAPVVATFHAAGKSMGYRMLGPVLSRLARRIDHRCAVSPAAVELARHHLGGEYELMPNAIEVDRFASGDPWPTEGPTVFFLGRHEPRKGLEVLLAAMGELGPEVRLWVGGEGPETDRLRDRHRHDARISWLGRLTDEEHASRLRAATVYCSPSLGGESFGIVLLEAMAAGTALLATDLDGHRNVATDGEDALLVPPGDPGALAGALRRLLGDPDLRARLVAGGTRRAAELDMGRLAAGYADRYRELVDGRG